MSTTFIEWLDQQEKITGFTDYEIAKRGGFSHSAISRARSGTPPGYEVCKRIATALNIPLETVLRKAGLLPQVPEFEEYQADILNETIDLSREDQREVLAYIRMKKEFRAGTQERTIPNGNLHKAKP